MKFFRDHRAQGRIWRTDRETKSLTFTRLNGCAVAIETGPAGRAPMRWEIYGEEYRDKKGNIPTLARGTAKTLREARTAAVAEAQRVCGRKSKALGTLPPPKKDEAQAAADATWHRYYDQELKRLLDNNAEASVSRNTARWYASHMTGREEP